MSRLTAIVERLPSLYRPELSAAADANGQGAPARSLFEALLATIATSLDEVHRQAGDVLQSRWVDFADRAAYSRFFQLSRRLDPTLDPRRFPHVRDLGRIAALLPLVPWQQPEALREPVEAFRLRVLRSVRLYREGLATVPAIRAAVEAALPILLDVPEPQRDRAFLIEELAPGAADARPVPTPGAPDFELGPMMRFSLRNRGRLPVHPTLYIQGRSLPAEGIGPTVDPMIELYRAGDRLPRVGIGLRGTLAADTTLRLRPAFSGWLAGAQGIRRAVSEPAEDAPANPAVDGPWAAPPGTPAAPTAAATALLQTDDHVLWAASGAGPTASLWRWGGAGWTEAVTGLPTVAALLQRGQELLAATASGLLRVPLFPPDGDPFAATPVAAFAGQAVHALLAGPAPEGEVWVGAARGLFRLAPGGAATAVGLGSRAALETPVLALTADDAGTLYVGTARGLFSLRAATGTWAFYDGGEATEQHEDWRPFAPDEPAAVLPGDEASHLPPVHAVLRGPDGALWIGTADGLARYVARPALAPSGTRVGGGLGLVAVLEAFPDVTAGAVRRLRTDARGQIWIASDRGVYRHDGRDLWHLEGADWVQLGAADLLYPAGRAALGRGTWRFDRASSRWQRFDEPAGRWNDFSEALRSTDEPAVADVTWCAEVRGDTGAWDGTTFSNPAPVDAALIELHVKPDEQRIVRGGIPAPPALPVGESVWRYLAMEPAGYTPPAQRPAWSPEGRLLPPGPAGEAPPPARFDVIDPPPASVLDGSVFAFPPAARVWAAWSERRARSVLVRLMAAPGESLDPAVVDRVWQAMQLVRPAGVRTVLAVNQKLVRGNDGNS